MRILTLIAMMLSAPLSAETLLLTGEVSSARSQIVTAPKTDRWQVMIQWLPEEGQVMEKGELVAVFDSGGIQAQLEQNQQNLETQKLELEKLQMDLTQAVTEAEGKLQLAELSVEKARIEASIEDGEVSAFDKGKFQIAYEKALMELIKAKENLKLQVREREVGLEKQKISIMRTEEDIAYQTSQLEKMSVLATVTGPASLMPHPWDNGNKIVAGSNVQASWNVLEIQAQQGFQVKAWIHEIDAARVDVSQARFWISLDAYPGTRIEGKLQKQSKQAELRGQWSDSAYYELTLAFDAPEDKPLSPGMSARVEVMLADNQGATQ